MKIELCEIDMREYDTCISFIRWLHNKDRISLFAEEAHAIRKLNA